MKHESILDDKLGAIALLTLNRPEKGNSFDYSLLNDLVVRVEKIMKDKTVKALVLTGSGERFFCTGADLREMGNSKYRPLPLFKKYGELLQLLSKAKCLTASFINGDCVGGGLGIALSTDFVLAKSTARLGTPEITKGLFPYILSPVIMRKLGEHRAKALCFGGRLWTAEEGLQYGAVSEMVDPTEFESRKRKLFGLWNLATEKILRRGKSALSHLHPPTMKTLVSYIDDAVLDFRKASVASSLQSRVPSPK